MTRSRYFDYIEEKLNVLAYRVSTRGKLNLLDLHGHSENFYVHLFNLLFGWQLTNLNRKIHNVEGIDLIDNVNKQIIQVSATCTKQKVNTSLLKPIMHSYSGYTFHFISITKDASALRKANFATPDSIYFPVATNIHDITTILRIVDEATPQHLKKIYQFIKDELGNEPDTVKLESNLASIISFLAKEDWDEEDASITVDSFEIERKIDFNGIKTSRSLIREHCIHHPRINAIYSEFDKEGVNKSKSVLAAIRREYSKLSDTDPDAIFHIVTDRITQKILQSSNFMSIPIDELELCVDILVVDAFIRCKIFENPAGYTYVAP